MSLGHNIKSLPLCPRVKSLSPEPVSQSLHFTNEFMMGINKNGHIYTQVSPPPLQGQRFHHYRLMVLEETHGK